MGQSSLDERLAAINYLRQRGESTQAFRLTQALLDEYPQHPSVLNVLAQVEHDRGNSAKALEIFQQLAIEYPQVWLTHFNLAAVAIDCNDFVRAEAALDAALPLHPEPENVYRSYEKLYIKTRNFTSLLGNYIRLLIMGKLRNKDRPNFFRCMENATLLSYFPEVEPEIIRYIDQPDHDPEAVRNFIFAQLNDKYADMIAAIDAGINHQQLAQLAADEFLQRILHEIIFSNPNLERLLQAIRRGLLSVAISDGEIPDDWLGLVEAITTQNWLNEYVVSIDDDEQDAIAQLIHSIETQCADPSLQWREFANSVSTTLLLTAMYTDPDTFACCDKLRSAPESIWPKYVRPLLSRLRRQQKNRELITSIPTLHPIEDQVSQKVQMQYEENPYPRWLRCARIATDNFGSWMKEMLPDYSPPHILSGNAISILIAGCGTGKQATQIARSFPQAKILAVDLSRASLAYARHKASHYNLKNLEFLQADILDLASLTQRFDVILCTGVLHHMAAIEPGWRVLRDLLNPDGVMQIALYSRLARQDIAEIRRIIAEHDVPATLAGIRAVRDLVFSGQLLNVSNARDFYSASNCRDLLFHVQEICSDIDDLQRMLTALELEFLGFDMLRVRNDFLIRGEQQIPGHDLNEWQRFEQQNPAFFEAMYHLWCTRKAG